jgi:ubiquinone/menaquinone biosynthesis C-methylase UbiE
MNRYLEEAEKYARRYDEGAADQGYCGPEVLFGLMFEYLEEADPLLDIAIGTGLGARLFMLAGASVYGIDGSAEMLKICEEKRVAVDLRQVDLLKDPIPYPDQFFKLAMANALFHMIDNPEKIVLETSRVLTKNGIFGFTFDETLAWKSNDYKPTGTEGISSMIHPESGLGMFRHSPEFIKAILDKSGFEVLRTTKFLAFRGMEGIDDFYFTAYISRKIPD